MKNQEQCVYIVDDDAAVRDSLGLLLGLNGYRTLPFSNADDFLKVCAPEWSGCLLLDIRMPVMDGIEATKRYREFEDHQDWIHSEKKDGDEDEVTTDDLRPPKRLIIIGMSAN